MQKFLKTRTAFVGGTTVLAALIFFGGFYTGRHYKTPLEKVTTLQNKEGEVPEKIDFAPFWKAWNALDERFVATKHTTTTPQDRVWGAIMGLTNSLKDPYTVFFPPENAKLFDSEIAGNFEGVGMEIGIKDETITVIAPLKGTPAARAGILSGDRILKIDDVVTNGMRVDEAVKHIRGKKGTAVTLLVFREGKKAPFEISVTRDVINIPTIDTELKKSGFVIRDSNGGVLQDGVFLIKLYSFSQPSPNLFRNALRQFIESGSNKLLLDLRGNPGGYLEAAVDMASWFLPVGEVVVREDFGDKAAPVVYRSSGYNVFEGRPLKFVILVNGGSASASEILAGALKEHGIAKLVGAKTFGKGSVQEIVKITPDTSLKVTVARWLTPNGNSISDVGITPDVEIKMTPDDVEKGKDPQMDRAIQLLLQ